MVSLVGTTVLVAGASGLVGTAAVERFLADGAEVLAVSRREPEVASERPFRHLPLDLRDRLACQDAAPLLAGVTHIVYAAVYEMPGLVRGWTDPHQMSVNEQMLRNLLDAIEPVARDLRHVHLVHGTKVYGSTLGPYKTPARESDPRVLVNNFYYEQEDLIAQRQQGKRWTWTTSRPQAVCDTNIAVVRNLCRLIGVYAAISRELGLALHFPGKLGAYTAIYQATDAAQLAKAIAWMAQEPRCANQTFNVTNGDYFRWVHLWPAFADHFALKPGQPRPVRLADAMQDKGALWDRIVARHALRPTPYAQAAIWPYGDFIFGHEYDVMSDVTKLHRYGYHDVVDSEAMFLRMFASLQAQKLLAP